MTIETARESAKQVAEMCNCVMFIIGNRENEHEFRFQDKPCDTPTEYTAAKVWPDGEIRAWKDVLA